MYSCTNPLCCGTICSGGSPMAWDHKCSPALSPPPTCNGVNEYVDYQCCPICHGTNSTTPPTTIPQTTTPTTTTLPLPFCFHNGQLYNNCKLSFLLLKHTIKAKIQKTLPFSTNGINRYKRYIQSQIGVSLYNRKRRFYL